MPDLRIGPHTLALSSPEKVLFPEEGITKGDLVRYYRRVASRMLPYLRDRPLTLHRFPRGIGEEGFIQQNASDYFPDFVDRATVPKEGGEVTHAVCNNEASLVYLANQNCITPHAWLSRADRPHQPDRLIFDFDPPRGVFEGVREGALALHDLLQQLGLTAFVMTTGSNGLHVVTPLDRRADFETVRGFARDVAEVLVRRHPDRLTLEQRKEQRRGRIFLDILRNAYGQTAVPPYAVRAKPGAPVATPLAWSELNRSDLHPQRYTLRNLFRRLGQQKQDPWAALEHHAHALEEARRRLESGVPSA